MEPPAFDMDDASTPAASLALLETILAHGPAGFAFLDRDLRYVRLNDRLAQFNALPADAHLGRTAREVLGPEQWALRQPLFERALAGEAVVDVVLPHPTLHHEARRPRVLACYHPVPLGSQVIGVAVMIRDMTDLAMAQEALEDREQEYRLLFDANPQPMWVYDTQAHRFLAVNDAAVADYGYTREEFLAMTIFDIRPAEDIPDTIRSIGVPRVGTLRDGPWRHLRRDGSLLWAEVAASPLDFHGQGARLIVAIDVTERLRAEQDRRDAARRRQSLLQELLASVTDGKLRLLNSPAELPAPLTPVGGPIPLTADELSALRHRVRAASRAAGHPEEQEHDLVLATGEAAMNALVHAGGGMARVSAGEDGAVQVLVEDQGTGIAMENLPRATLARGFSTKSTLGHGFKMMLETVDRLSLLTGPDGTTVVLEQERDRPLPAWL